MLRSFHTRCDVSDVQRDAGADRFPLVTERCRATVCTLQIERLNRQLDAAAVHRMRRLQRRGSQASKSAHETYGEFPEQGCRLDQLHGQTSQKPQTLYDNDATSNERMTNDMAGRRS